MGVPTSSATIEFPAARIDEEIRKVLEEEGVRFKPRVFGPIMELDDMAGDSLELDKQLYDLEVEVEDGIFRLKNGEARYGEFEDLEGLLVKKGIPFDRNSGMDWNRPPVTRVFRPGTPPIDVEIPDGEESAGPMVRLLTAAKAVLPDISALLRGAPQLLELEAAIKEAEEIMPNYPPLADAVGLGAAS